MATEASKQLLQLLGQGQGQADQPPALNPTDLLRQKFQQAEDDLSRLGVDELTRGAIGTAHEQLMRLAGQPPVTEGARRLGVRPGFPMDVNEGVSAGERAQLGLDPDTLNQIKFLIRRHGPDAVEVSEDGHLVLRNQIDPISGIRQDVMVNPPGFESGDVAELGSQLLPMALGAVTAGRATRLPLGKIARAGAAIVSGAGAQRMAQGEQQAITRLVRGDEVNIPSIVKERALDAGADAILGTLMAGGTGALRLLSPFSHVTPAIAKANLARARLNKELLDQLPDSAPGLRNPLPTTPGLKSGSSFLLRAEAQARRIPGSAGVFDKITEAEQAAVDEMRRIALGAPRTLTDDELRTSLPQADVVGQKALGKLGNLGLQAESAVKGAQAKLLRTGTGEARLIGQAPLAEVNTTQVGKGLIDRVKSDWNDFHEFWGRRYDEFFSKPETTELNVPANKLAAMAKSLRERFTPLVKKIKQTPTGLVNEAGDPITTPVEVIEGLDNFVQTRVLGALDELASMRGGQTSIRSLKQIRTNIDDAIAQNQAIPGTDTGQLQQIRRTLSDTISESLRDKDPALLAEWNAINKGWADNMKRFDFNKIRDILIKPGQPGAPGETEVAERVLGDSAQSLDAWNSYKQFFGPSSPEMQDLAHAVRFKIFDAEDGARGYISGPAFRRKLENLRPEVAKDVFGVGTREQLLDIADAISIGQGKLDAGEAVRLSSMKGLTKEALTSLETAEAARASTYKNALVKAASRGALNPEVVQPSEFVRYMTNGKLKIDPSDIHLVRSITDQDPELAKQITQLSVEDFFEQAGMAGPKRSRILWSQDIDKTLGDEVQQRRWEALMGKSTVDAIKDLAEALRPGAVAAESFSAAGSQSGGQVTAKVTGGKFEGLPEIAKRRIIAGLYATPVVRNLLVNNMMSSDNVMRLVNAMVTSEPFATEMLRRAGPDIGMDIMGSLQDWLNSLWQERADQRVGRQFPSAVNPAVPAGP